MKRERGNKKENSTYEMEMQPVTRGKMDSDSSVTQIFVVEKTS